MTTDIQRDKYFKIQIFSRKAFENKHYFYLVLIQKSYFYLNALTLCVSKRTNHDEDVMYIFFLILHVYVYYFKNKIL